MSQIITRNVRSAIETRVNPLGFLGIFGKGLFRVFYGAGGTFTIPPETTSIRVRCVGAGKNGSTNTGSGGGGYAHGVFQVVPGTNYAVSAGGDGATSSFGALISATGGLNGNSGGGAGSQLGAGGNGTNAGGGVGLGHTSVAGGGGSPFGLPLDGVGGAPDITGVITTGSGDLNRINAIIRFPFDGFTGGGGANATPIGHNGGSGGGGGNGQGTSGGHGGKGGVGGGGGSGYGGGNGGFGGGGGARVNAGGTGSVGGVGLVIVEW